MLERIEADKAREEFADFDLWFERCKVWMGVRERTKATCVLTINEQRLDAYEIGSRLVADGTLRAPEDVYFMTLHDLTVAVESGSVDRELIDHRRAAQAELERHQEPLFVIAGQTVPVAEWPPKASEASPSDVIDEIGGAAGSPGRASGRARIVRNAYADEPTEPGEVLVAPITDPGWMHLFVGAVAVVAEMGGELSHTMIVSRALGIPAVVGAVGATSAIRTGDLVEVDGSRGVVRILERA